ncbi:glutamine amidotransferase-related protein [Methylobrevis albus]|uniref:CTP synthase (glutamine hydrolyzing) n=1 Tax=Methylobrevis albus TaxID=2793297 RepID=A0A931MWQ8_9HYPH|nr:gamma-glutamyl-gamma-aminobutyrate hydrolase family protein [Methylobrevis albus]MBH0237623.1 gamma-glutamyl-gamma-aminobutyrate hydrolase family protein [Methylobrevis albus]
MGLILISHDRPEPALYGAIAGAAAMRLGARLMHLPARFDTARYADAVQHVTAGGTLVPSGLVWGERLGGAPTEAPSSPAEIAAAAATGMVLLPINPGVDPDAIVAAAGGGSVRRLAVVEEHGAFLLIDEAGALDTRAGRWRRDRLGRLDAADLAADGSTAPALVIALVGTEDDHRNVYPAALTSLADAAEAAGFRLEPVFLPPQALDAAGMRAALTAADGVLLPGGADMANVAGQIAAAHAALDLGVPAVGLCLGMQTMTTAVAQRALGAASANLAEADPDAPVKTFVPIAADGTVHRLGDRTIRTEPGTRLSRLLGPEATIRCNHRYRLAPDLEAPLAAAGLRVAARGEGGTIIDAVELTGDVFYAGMQGHPELSSRRGAPHPLLAAFIAACTAHRADQA